jgi:ribosome maturation factor RimP
VGQKPAFFVDLQGMNQRRNDRVMDAKKAETQVNEWIADDLSAMGYDLVQARMLSGARYLTLQILAERADGRPMTVEDCVQISRAVVPRLEEQDLADVTLEVSSPGIDRPLVQLKDYERFAGQMARIDLSTPMDNGNGPQKRFQGKIVRTSGRDAEAEVELRTEAGAVRLPIQRIARAKLVMQDGVPSSIGDNDSKR